MVVRYNRNRMRCLKNSVNIVLLQVALLLSICFTSAQNTELDCDKSDQPIACRSSQLINNIVSHIVSRNDDDETLKILPGIEIIQNEQKNTVNSNERSMHNGVKENDTILSRVTRYLQTHDLKVKFSDLVGKADLQDAVNTFFGDSNQPMTGMLINFLCIIHKE